MKVDRDAQFNILQQLSRLQTDSQAVVDSPDEKLSQVPAPPCWKGTAVKKGTAVGAGTVVPRDVPKNRQQHHGPKPLNYTKGYAHQSTVSRS
jgi:hypothetical protein